MNALVLFACLLLKLNSSKKLSVWHKKPCCNFFYAQKSRESIKLCNFGFLMECSNHQWFNLILWRLQEWDFSRLRKHVVRSALLGHFYYLMAGRGTQKQVTTSWTERTYSISYFTMRGSVYSTDFYKLLKTPRSLHHHRRKKALKVLRFMSSYFGGEFQ